MVEVLSKIMEIRDIMTKSVISVSPNASLEEVSELLLKNGIHGIPVVDKKQVVGIITETDFFTKGSEVVYLPEYINDIKKDAAFEKIQAEKKEKMSALMDLKVKDVMSKPCVTIKQNESLSLFIEIIKEKKLKSIPVVNENDEIVGIVTMSNVLPFLKI